MLDVIFNRYLTAPTPGGWYDQIDPNGRVISKDMPTSSFYHVFCALVEYLRTRKCCCPERRHACRNAARQSRRVGQMAAKFGTSGLRGLVGDLTDGTAAAHARAFARHLGLNAMAQARASPHFHRPRHARLKPRDRPPMRRGTERGRSCSGRLRCPPTPALALYAMGHGRGRADDHRLAHSR
jgi:hypothetical protein